MNENKMIRTPRKGARVGDKEYIAGQPVVVIKSGKNRDFMTAEEVAEALYGQPVDHIVFKQRVTKNKEDTCESRSCTPDP